MPTKNDCVLCHHENDDNPMFCDFYQERIGVPGLTEINKACRQQESCDGFLIAPHMLSSWERKFGTAPARWRVPEPTPLEVDEEALRALVGRLTEIATRAQLDALLAEVRAMSPATSGWESPFDLDNPEQHAAACLHLAAHGVVVETTRRFWYRVLHTDVQGAMHGKLRATCMYLVLSAPNPEFLHELLVSDDPLRPSRLAVAHPQAPYHMVDWIGISGRSEFVPLLGKLLTIEHHFVAQRVILRSLEALNTKVSDQDHTAGRSISIHASSTDDEIIIDEDPKYGGGSECPGCQYFPCRINRHYTGGIESCKLWNKVDPSTRGKIRDYRTWGKHLQTTDTPNAEGPGRESLFEAARSALAQGSPRDAIAPLCEILVAEQELGEPLAWLMLSECMEQLDEHMLAFLYLREASGFARLAGALDERHTQRLERYASNHEQMRASFVGLDYDDRVYDNLGFAFRDAEDWVSAFDCYVGALLVRESAAYWMRIAKAHLAFDELHFAELCMRKATAIATTTSLTTRFRTAADEVRARLDDGEKQRSFAPRPSGRSVVRRSTGPQAERARALALHRRSDEFRQVDEPFDPMRLEFVQMSERALEQLRAARDDEGDDEGKRVFSLHNAGQTILAVEMIQIELTSRRGLEDKANLLALAGSLLAEAGDRAKRSLRLRRARELYRLSLNYFAWASDLAPADTEVSGAVDKLIAMLG